MLLNRNHYEKNLFSSIWHFTCFSFQAHSQVAGVVVVGEGECSKRNKVVIETNMRFSLVEQYSGKFARGDKVVGDLNGYGFKDVLVNGRAGRVYVADYRAYKDKATRWCYNK